ncbi:MAG TPA: hypothetical protein VFH66_06655 [Mycobacteriales bacterium]|nr:hypothetical protein [Mycobacteriales bacterium]
MPILVAPATADGFRGFAGDKPGKVLDQDLVVTLGGINLGTVHDSGVRMYVTNVVGWWNGSGSTGEVTQRVAADGGWSNRPYRAARHIELDVDLWGLDFDHVTPVLEEVVAAIPLRGDVLQVSKASEALQATVQQDGDVLVDRSTTHATLTIALVAPDPRRYDVSTVTATTGLPTTAGGMSLPLSLPLSIGASINSGRIITDTFGNTDTPPVFTVNGPCPPFQIAHSMADDPSVPRSVLRFAEAVPDGRSLTIDTARRLALMDGTATRTVTGTWFSYLPGKNGQPGLNQIDFTADSYDPGAQLVGVHRDAWK